MNNERRNRSGFSLSAILLILLGVVFLLNNFGLLPWEVWSNIWKFWPVLLILFGLEILLGRQSSPKGLGFLLLLIFLVPVVLIINPLTGNPLATGSENFSKPLGSLVKTQFNFNFQSLNLKVSALEAGDEVFKGSVRYSQILPKPTLTEDKRLGEATYTFAQPTQTGLPFLNNLGNTLSFQITKLIPVEINTKATSGVINLDLNKLRVSESILEINTGQVNVTFANDFSSKVFIKTGASIVNLTIPKEIAASIKTSSALKSLTIDQKRFPKQGDFYQTTDFSTNQNKVQIEISGQATSVTVK